MSDVALVSRPAVLAASTPADDNVRGPEAPATAGLEAGATFRYHGREQSS